MSPYAPLIVALLLVGADAPAQPAHHQHKLGHHRFQDAEKWARVFESPERDRWQKPKQVLAVLQIKPTMKVAEIGSGTGYFIVRMARQVARGKAYGVDIEADMVQYLARRAKQERLPNLASVLGAADDPRIPEPVDLILLCDTYHHIDQRTRYFRRLADRLRPGGRLVIVDFKQGKLPVGPPESMRVAPAQLRKELSAAGYRETALDTRTLPYQYIAVFQSR